MRNVSSAALASTTKSILEFVSTIAGFTAIFSALLLYFGYVRTQSYFAYFGVPVGILEFATTDYLLRSPDVFFKPVIWSVLALAVLCVLAVTARRIETRGSNAARRVVRGSLAVATVLTASYAVLGLADVVVPDLAGISLALSGALVIIQFDMYRSGSVVKPPTVVAAVGALFVVMAAFWSTAVYAESVGVQSAAILAQGNGSLRQAVVYTSKDLPLTGETDLEEVSSRRPLTWKYSYDGYRVLIYANDRWFLIRDEWNPGDLTVILPGDDDSIFVALLPARLP